MDDLLLEYIERVLRLQERRSALSLDTSDLEEIARELGLSPADLEAVDVEVVRHRQRAAGYLRHQLVDDALVELDHASALAPHDPDVLMEYAQALVSKWELGDPEAGSLAHRLALRVLDRDAQRDDAFELIARLRAGPPRRGFTPPVRPGQIPTSMAEPTYGLVLLPWRSSRSLPTPQSAHDEKLSSTGYFSFSGWVRNDSATELIELSAVMELVDVDGRTHDRSLRHALTATTPPIRPGDTFGIDGTWDACEAEIAEARLRITTFDARPAARQYPAGTPVELSWAVPAPPGVSLNVTIRERTRFAGDPAVILAITHTGERSIDSLALDLVDAGGRDPMTIAYRGGHPLFPGETRAVYGELSSDGVQIDRVEVREIS